MAGCERCGEAVDLDGEMEEMRLGAGAGWVCRECRMAPPEFARAVAYGVHDGELRELIRLLKFEHVPAVAKLLGGRLAEIVLELEGQAARELMVVAVPLYAGRERWRGFNQAVLLADAACARLKRMRPEWKLRRAHGVIERVKDTESSYRLSRKERRVNLRGAFKMAGDVTGREVLLVDDIYTSGATARECARVLMDAGAAKVWVATLARAQKARVRRQHEDPGEYVAAWDQARDATV